MKKILYLLGFLILIIAGIFLYYKFFRSSNESKTGSERSFGKLASQLEGLIVKPTKLVQEIEVSGTLQPFDETILMPEVAGRVITLNIQEGKPVTKGALLVKLFDEDLQSQLKMLQVQLQIAENNEQRMKTLFNVKGTSQQEYDASLLQVNNLKAQIDVMKVNIGKTEIKAPYNGIVGLKKISPGQYITPSTQIATIRAVNTLKLDFSIPEKYSHAVRQGNKVEFFISGMDTKFNATIAATEASIESDSRNLNVRALVDANSKGLLPGAFAKVKAVLGSKDDALMIPTSSIVPQASVKKVYVARNGKAAFVTITTGVREADNIEVLSGLKAGDTLVTTGILFIKQNNTLKFSKVK